MTKEEREAKEALQTIRESRCHAECEEYYRFNPMTPEEKKWFHRGVEIGAKWVDSGDRIII